MPDDKRKLPTFFLVGAPKAGTTSLYHHLDQHPEVYMSPLKEVAYFAQEVRPQQFAAELQPQVQQEMRDLRVYLDGDMRQKRFGGIVTEWEDYCRLFAQVKGETAIGEASVCYLWSKSAAEQIAKRLPAAKILMVLRNPVDRAFSQYLHNVSARILSCSFREHLHASLKDDSGKFNVHHPFLEVGLYAEQVQRYQQHFPAAQIGLWLYEETGKPGFQREVLEFLGVNADFAADTSKQHLRPQVLRALRFSHAMARSGAWRRLRSVIPETMRPGIRKMIYRNPRTIRMGSAERKILIDYYREDILKLEGIVERDLSAWLR